MTVRFSSGAWAQRPFRISCSTTRSARSNAPFTSPSASVKWLKRLSGTEGWVVAEPGSDARSTSSTGGRGFVFGDDGLDPRPTSLHRTCPLRTGRHRNTRPAPPANPAGRVTGNAEQHPVERKPGQRRETVVSVALNGRLQRWLGIGEIVEVFDLCRRRRACSDSKGECQRANGRAQDRAACRAASALRVRGMCESNEAGPWRFARPSRGGRSDIE